MACLVLFPERVKPTSKVSKNLQSALSHCAPAPVRAATSITVGFVPLLDAAPLVAALELGYFRAEGLDVRLTRQLGWGSIFAGLAYSQLEVAHAPFPMLLALAEFSREGAADAVSRWVLNRNGNAITLSNRLKLRGVTDAASFAALACSMRPAPISLGVVSRHSMHALILRLWLRQAGLDPDRHARFVCLPPSQMIGALEEEYIEGFCAGEPWNGLAVNRGKGWIVSAGEEVLPGHPEKVLAVSRSFDVRRREEHAALLRALAHAARDVQNPEYRSEIARLLARKEYLNLDAKVLSECLHPEQETGHPIRLLFHGAGVNTASQQECTHIAELWAREGLGPSVENLQALCRDLFLPTFPPPANSRRPAL